jgi:hypothetical protein
LVYVRYQDHVIFSRCDPLLMKPQIREAIGWLNYECDYYLTVSWDRDAEPPTLKGGDAKASGLVLLKSAILEFKKLEVSVLPLQNNLEYHLNSQKHSVGSEYAFRPTERKTHKVNGETAK